MATRKSYPSLEACFNNGEKQGSKQPAIKVSVNYCEGGYNWFNGGMMCRGVELRLIPVTIEEHTNLDGSTWKLSSHMLGAGNKVVLKDLTRRNRRKEELAWSLIEPKAEEIARLYAERDFDAINAICKEVAACL